MRAWKRTSSDGWAAPTRVTSSLPCSIGSPEHRGALFEERAQPLFGIGSRLAEGRRETFGIKARFGRHGADLGDSLDDEGIDGRRIFRDAFGQFEGLFERMALGHDMMGKAEALTVDA